MKFNNLIRRVRNNIALTATVIGLRTKNYLTTKKITALSLVGNMAGIITLGTLLPLQNPAFDENLMASKNQIEKVASYKLSRNLVLDTASINKMIEFDDPETFTITIDESQAQKQERITREESSKNRQTVITTTSSTPTVSDVSFEEKRALAQAAANAFGIDWKILEAVWQVESGKRYYTAVRSYAGAQGPMQFMPATWRTYQVDGNGDGVADIHNAEDAIYGAAKLLATNGAAENIDQALLAYNHAQWYVDKVKAIANSI